jgi:hypothetical protein
VVDTTEVAVADRGKIAAGRLAIAIVGRCVIGVVIAWVEQRQTSTRLAAAAAAVVMVVVRRDTVYGAVVVRCTIVGFGALGAQSAQGTSPTKRSPTGLASGVGWALMFTALS